MMGVAIHIGRLAMEKMLTPNQVAEILQVHPDTVVRWLRDGILKGIKLGGVWRIRAADLEALAAKGGG